MSAIRLLTVQLYIDNTKIVRHSSDQLRRTSPASGFHAEGRDHYRNLGVITILRAEETKLTKRIKSFCQPKSIMGYFALLVRRRRLIRKLRKRFELPYAMFLAQGIISDRSKTDRRISETSPQEPQSTVPIR